MPTQTAYDPYYARSAQRRTPAYAYDSTAPAYEPEPYANPAYPDTYPENYPDISVVPGGRQQHASHTLSPGLLLAARVVAIAIVILGVIGIVQITLNASAVNVAMEAQEYSTQLDTARSQASDLEVTLASLSNPTRIKSEAQALGMGSSEETYFINLADDPVVTDETGALSLSGSIAALTAIQASS